MIEMKARAFSSLRDTGKGKAGGKGGYFLEGELVRFPVQDFPEDS